jgi:hypothetical protein
MKYLSLLIFFTCIIIYSCNSSNPVTPKSETIVSNYVNIDSVQSGTWKFIINSGTAQTLNYGYNDIGFKVYNNGAEMTTGYVKYNPVMTQNGGTGCSSPVSPVFNYNADQHLFTGYVCFTQYSDTGKTWQGFYDYNGVAKIDSVPFTVYYYLYDNIKTWTDATGGHSYVLTLINPTSPTLGLNSYSVMLHKTDDNTNFSEVDNATFGIYVLMVTHGHSSSNNVNPVYQSNGKYTGQINFSMSGKWAVYDTLKINGSDITNNQPQKFNFSVQ